MAETDPLVERVEVPGAELWTETTGSGLPVVLAHGGSGMSDNLGPVGALVDDLVRVHRYDQRACGRSTGLGRGQTVASAVSDLDALREHWGYESWIVGGHSWGAALALFFALALPERTEAVIYMSGPGISRPTRSSARTRMERLTEAEQEALSYARSRAADGDAAAARELAHLFWLTDFSDRAKAPDFDLEPLFRYPRNADAADALSASADERRDDDSLASTVATLRVPALVLHGRDDPLPVEGAIELASILPAAELTILDRVGHTIWLEDPASTKRALRSFLRPLLAG